DSLGWSYQFWQAQKKEDVQRQMKQAGTKVGADELPAVTQLFTEQYMVAFQLENALGAWMQSRHPRMALLVDMPYFRKLDDGTPAAGTFPAWPDSLATFTLLDPCLGSGHFLVSAFHYLVPLRCATEKLSVRNAVDRVLADNLYGLELDARCVEIAAFALALAAWRYPDEKGNVLGYRALPRLNIACVGVAPRSKKVDWLKLAEGDRRLEDGMAALYDLFQKAPELGSLIDPKAATQGDLISAQWDELAAKLDLALSVKNGEPETDASLATAEARVTALGMLHASRILNKRYHLVITNPPYLGANQQGPVIKTFCESEYNRSKGDLANVFLERCIKLCGQGGAVSFVMPQNWLFLGRQKAHREYLLRNASWHMLARLGSGAFETITGEVVNAILLTLTRNKPDESQCFRGIDASQPRSVQEKSELLLSGSVVELAQLKQLDNPDSVVSLDDVFSDSYLGEECFSWQGIKTSDDNRFTRGFWEIASIGLGWRYYQRSPESNGFVGGKTDILFWQDGYGALTEVCQEGASFRGKSAWGKAGICVGTLRLNASIYSGEHFASEITIIQPKRIGVSLAALWVFLNSDEFVESLKKVDSKVAVTNSAFGRVPFDVKRWEANASELFPSGLPKPYSDDPTQWIFHGHPQPATHPLQVAVARLLGYRWPAESDAAMELSSEARAWIARCQELDSLADDDGILCLPAVRGEAAAVDRLRALLSRSFGADWTGAREAKCLKDAGCDGLPLGTWLRDKFFEQHVARFQKRPFIWHVWDGHKDGFSALLNYHTLTRAKLQTLIHTYLGDWITQQRRTVEAGGAQAGEATLKLAKAEALKLQLETIAQGEKPYDIFVRWKPLHQQPIGWEPDLNDGVRMNIHPFVEAGVLRIPRAKLGLKWESDRGKDVASAPWFKLGPTYDEPEGTRINDHHLSLAEKQAAKLAQKLTKS
ncbi:MAG: Eco57I restriction-modification methylase domain-containing protein, partial [Rhodoferax sp.]